MAAATLPKPGTEYGPCAKECEHTDCAHTRRMAKSTCTICGKPIGYDTRFYRSKDGDPTDGPWDHARCVEDKDWGTT